MKKFLFSLLIFSIPILLFIIPPVYVLISSGENFKSVDKVILSNKKYLIGYAYNERNYSYLKWKVINGTQPYKVWTLGSSRVLQFRRQMFSAPFYNAGYTITGVEGFVPFLKSIPANKYPKYLLVALDQWMFNKAWDDVKKSSAGATPLAITFVRDPDIPTLSSVWGDLISHKYGLRLPHRNDSLIHIGLNAVINNKGFKNDGSMFYGDQITKLLNHDKSAEDYGFKSTFDRIDKGKARFEYGDKVNPDALNELDNFFSFCKANHIQVVVFIPPFADKVTQKMAASGRYNYLKSLYPAVSNVCAKYQVESYNFSTLASCNSNDAEMLDGFHGGELTCAKILINILKSHSALNNVANLQSLQKDAGNAINRYQVYKR